MDAQQKINHNLLQGLSRIIAVFLLLILFFVALASLVKPLDEAKQQSLHQEYLHLKLALTSIHSQWVIRGKPRQLLVSWQNVDNIFTEKHHSQSSKLAQSRFWISRQGFPIPAQASAAGCQQLWDKLLGINDRQLKIQVFYTENSHICQFRLAGSGKIVYDFALGQMDYFDEQE